MVVIINWKKYYTVEEAKKKTSEYIKKTADELILELRKRREEYLLQDEKTRIVKHLAILNQPFLSLILEWKKTIETRFSKVKCAPHWVIKKWDIVLLKASPWQILWQFSVAKVESFFNTRKEDIEKLKIYSNEICSYVDENFWEKRLDKKYVTLIWVDKVEKYDFPINFIKKDRRWWVVLK